MRERLGRVLSLLQATPFPPDLIDNPARTDQWLLTLGNLQQAVALLRADRDGTLESRGERVIRTFNRMIDGLPVACLNGLSPIIKLGLIRPLLADLENLERRLRGLQLSEVGSFTARLTQYRSGLAAMASRHAAPDPPISSAPAPAE